MPFAALDDGFHASPKVIRAGLDGTGLYARALSYCADRLTDGFVLYEWAAELAKPAVRKKVTTAGLWIEVVGGETFDYVDEHGRHTVTVPARGYFIPDYLEFNPSKRFVIAKKDELSEKRSEAGKKGARARWGKRDSKAEVLPSISHGKTVASECPPSPKPLARGESVTQFERDSGRQFELNGLPIENELLSARLMQAIGDHADQGTASMVRKHAAKLPPASFAKVIESLEIQGGKVRDRAAYALTALGDELAERETAA